MSDDDDLDYRIARLRLGPNDILVLKTEQELSEDYVHLLRKQLRAALPPEQRILVLTGGMDLEVAVREQGA